MPSDLQAAHALINWAPLLRLLGLALVIALVPLSWWWLRQRGAPLPAKLAALIDPVWTYWMPRVENGTRLDTGVWHRV